MTESTSGVKIIPTACAIDCGGRCLLRAHVKDGVILRIETDEDESEPQLKACVRGRAYRQGLYAQDRLKHPLKRVGARGEGKFERISWDEALDTIANQIKRIKETYGLASILVDGGFGRSFQFFGVGTIMRLFFMLGGCCERWGSMSNEGGRWASDVTYGTVVAGNSRDDLLKSRLVIMWGWNPSETIWSTGTPFSLIKVKEAGVKIVCVDPRFTNTAATFANQWIPIKPGTDAAMMIAMAYTIIKENLHDQKFIDAFTTGFDRFKEYVLGIEDGIPKTPAWAERITGVMSETIENLAREYATAKPAALVASYAPGRSAYGEQYHRAASTLAAMTGNVGIHGGFAAGMLYIPVGPNPFPRERLGDKAFPDVKNPLKPKSPPSLDAAVRLRHQVHTCKLSDAILMGKAGGYPSDIKMAYLACGNHINQRPNANKAAEAFKKLEFVVVHEIFMTATAKFADILLPAAMSAERSDIIRPWNSGAYYLYASKAAEPPDECKTDFEICCELAPRLGIHNYSDKTEDEWLREYLRAYEPLAKEVPDGEEFKKKGFHKIRLPEPVVAFKKQIEDPGSNPFPTPSGKIEIYSQRLANLNNSKIPPIPKYFEPWESPNNPLAQKYPLQLITSHSKIRAHSTLDNIPWLRELEPQAVWLNPRDAQIRGIADGDRVRVFNDRGQMIIRAKVTERIMPGVVNVNEGAWYAPDDSIDRGGCANTLTKDECSPGGAPCTNTGLVQVTKA